MNATSRGTRDHAVLESFETARKRLRAMPGIGSQYDRVAVVMAMMLADKRCTALDALGAADRIFPLPKGRAARGRAGNARKNRNDTRSLKGHHMPRTDETYPDKFMKAAHIDEWLNESDEEHAILTIKSTDITEYSDGKKQILLRFRETHLELGLNKGNATALAGLFQSTESDDWIGKKVALHTEDVASSMSPTGRSRAIRVSTRQTAKANQPKQVASSQPRPDGKPSTPGRKPAPMTQEEVEDDDAIPDDIPF